MCCSLLILLGCDLCRYQTTLPHRKITARHGKSRQAPLSETARRQVALTATCQSGSALGQSESSSQNELALCMLLRRLWQAPHASCARWHADATFLFNDALGRLNDVKEAQAQIGDAATFSALPDDAQADCRRYLRQVRSCVCVCVCCFVCRWVPSTECGDLCTRRHTHTHTWLK